MDNLQAYIFLFNDSLLTSLMFVPRTSYATDVMVMLGNYNPYLIFIISFIASIIGLSINWIFGSFIRKLERLERFASRLESLQIAENFFNRRGKWILLLSAFPLWGALLTTGAGVLRFNLFHFLILVSFSKFIGLAFQIFF